MKVVIFCGGQGLRMREASEVAPKPMIPIGGKPIIERRPSGRHFFVASPAARPLNGVAPRDAQRQRLPRSATAGRYLRP